MSGAVDVVVAGFFVAVLVVALLAATVPSITLLVRHGSRGRTRGIPFAPLLAFGGLVALAVGGPLG